jgi:ribonuclease HI
VKIDRYTGSGPYMLSKLQRSNWTVVFSWIKVHVGIEGNVLADQTAKAAARDYENTTAFN